MQLALAEYPRHGHSPVEHLLLLQRVHVLRQRIADATPLQDDAREAVVGFQLLQNVLGGAEGGLLAAPRGPAAGAEGAGGFCGRRVAVDRKLKFQVQNLKMLHVNFTDKS